MIKLDWTKVNWDDFEFMALDYAKFKYPEFDWKKSPSRGHDQKNHDIEAIANGINLTKAGFSYEEIVLNESYQVWGEVKHSNNSKKRVGKQQLDPTVVSALIAGNVVFLLFITNRKFTSSYRIRAEKALFGTTKFFDYVDIEDIENWLINKPLYQKKYFETSYTQPQSNPQPFSIKDISIFDFNDLRNHYYSVVKQMKINEAYVLYISFKSSESKVIKFVNEKSLPFRIEMYKGFDLKNGSIQINKGFTGIYLFIKTLKVVKSKPIHFEVLTDRNELIELDTNLRVTITPFSNITIAFSQQVKLIDRISHLIKEEKQSQLIALIFAKAGVGKSQILEKLHMELSPRNEFIKIDFKENANVNSQKICELILFLNFGEIFRDLDQSIIDRFEGNIRHLDISFLTAIQKIREKKDGKNFKLEELLNFYFDSSIINPQRLNQPKIVLCDDIHKLDHISAKAIARIMSEIIENDLNVFFICTAREYEFSKSTLKNLQNTIPIQIHRISSPTPQDILQTLHFYFDLPAAIDLTNFLKKNQLPTLILN